MGREIHNIGLIVKCLDNTIMRRALDDIPEEKKLPVSLNTVSAYLGISPSAVRFICSLDPEQLSGLDAILCSRSGFGDLLRIFGSEEAVDIDVLQYKASRITSKILEWIRK